MVYFLIGTQLLNGNEEYTWSQIKSQVFSGTLGNNADGRILKSEKEKFRLGNLDSLMFINDQITKLETQVESILKKIERQYQDIDEESANTAFKVKTRDGQYTLERYLKEFLWDDSKFARNQPIQVLLKEIQNRMIRVENELKSKTQQLQENKSLQAQSIIKDANLISRDLSEILKEPLVSSRDFVNTQYLSTFVLVVPKNNLLLLKQNYELTSENVVAGSLQEIGYHEKDGTSLWTVKLLKVPMNKLVANPVEEFAKNMRDQFKITVREFNFVPGLSEQKDVKRHELEQKSQVLSKTLKQSCEQSFSEIYMIYIHLKHLKFIVDSVMRFGVNEKYLMCLIQPFNGKEKKVQQSLLKVFNDSSQIGVYGTKEELDDVEDFFPFIYVPVVMH